MEKHLSYGLTGQGPWHGHEGYGVPHEQSEKAGWPRAIISSLRLRWILSVAGPQA